MNGEGSKGSEGRRLRQPIVVVLGHVDHGKTTLLDKIRKTAVAAKEAGGITQHIGASIVPADVIEKIAEPLKKFINIKLVIPGLLFIDTPGHELFSNLRRRGGSVADFAILVVDIMEGFKPQTYEAIELLKERRVPFLVAANKIDRIPFWESKPDTPFLFSYRAQSPKAREEFERRVYELVGKLYEVGFPADLFFRIKDFRRKVAIVPVSAKTGEGIPDLLAVLAGLTQSYLRKRLVYAEGPARGVVLEVKEQPGLGTVVDAVIYDGVLNKGDIIVVGGKEGPIVTTVRALLMPAPLQDIRSREARFIQVDSVYAAAGVRIAAPHLDEVLAGSPLYVARNEEEAKKLGEEVEREISKLRFRTDNVGVVVKADTLGTLEALVAALERRGVPVRIADIGPVTRNDILDAEVTRKINKYLGIVLAFNVKVLPEAEEEASRAGVKVFVNNVIYKLIEDYEEWVEKEKEKERVEALNKLVRPGKVRILPGYVFRRSNPAIVGVEVLGGVIRPGYPLMTEDGREVGRIMAIRERDRSLEEARLGDAVAISIHGRVLVGRHINEGDILYTNVPAIHAEKILTDYRDLISKDELEVLKEIIEIKKKSDENYRRLAIKLKFARKLF
ncbi:MAG: translation initiation factor IF-2 [Desulfurococcales archaeon]|nr:translation initiation factor IF-2 [Desulfurococcales archaeon]